MKTIVKSFSELGKIFNAPLPFNLVNEIKQGDIIYDEGCGCIIQDGKIKPEYFYGATHIVTSLWSNGVNHRINVMEIGTKKLSTINL